jgi:hypothetical protein
MSLWFSGKVNSSTEVSPTVKPEVNVNIKVDGHHTKNQIVIVANPIIKTLGLVFLFGVMTLLNDYALVNPTIIQEMTRLIFLCAIALLMQKDSNSRAFYTDRIVERFLYV